MFTSRFSPIPASCQLLIVVSWPLTSGYNPKKGPWKCGFTSKTVNVGETQREYRIGLPDEVCDKHNRHKNKYPLIFLFPGTTGDSEALIGTLHNMSQVFKFISFEVKPHKGLWNAGSVMNNDARADDVDCVHRMLVLAHRHKLPISDLAIYVLGHGSGAIMAARLAAEKWVRGIALLGGSIYDVKVDAPKPSLLYWGEKDKVISFDGCCASQTPPCCCDISSPQCISAPKVFDAWRKANLCQGGEAAASQESGYPNTQCLEGAGCAASTTFCRFKNLDHRLDTTSVGGVPKEMLAGQIMVYFQKAACSNNGKWLHNKDMVYGEFEHYCQCLTSDPLSGEPNVGWGEEYYHGRYCLVHARHGGKEKEYMAVIIAVAAGLCCIGCSWFVYCYDPRTGDWCWPKSVVLRLWKQRSGMRETLLDESGNGAAGGVELTETESLVADEESNADAAQAEQHVIGQRREDSADPAGMPSSTEKGRYMRNIDD